MSIRGIKIIVKNIYLFNMKFELLIIIIFLIHSVFHVGSVAIGGEIILIF